MPSGAAAEGTPRIEIARFTGPRCPGCEGHRKEGGEGKGKGKDGKGGEGERKGKGEEKKKRRRGKEKEERKKKKRRRGKERGEGKRKRRRRKKEKERKKKKGKFLLVPPGGGVSAKRPVGGAPWASRRPCEASESIRLVLGSMRWPKAKRAPGF